MTLKASDFFTTIEGRFEIQPFQMLQIDLSWEKGINYVMFLCTQPGSPLYAQEAADAAHEVRKNYGARGN